MELDRFEQLTLDVVRQHNGLLPSEVRTHVCQTHPDVRKRDVRSALARLWDKGYVNLGHDLRVRPVTL